MAAGALAGVLASFFLRLPIRGVWKDAVLGLSGFMGFFVTNLFSRLVPLDPVPGAGGGCVVRHCSAGAPIQERTLEPRYGFRGVRPIAFIDCPVRK
jgi:hypothetical protein